MTTNNSAVAALVRSLASHSSTLILLMRSVLLFVTITSLWRSFARAFVPSLPTRFIRSAVANKSAMMLGGTSNATPKYWNRETSAPGSFQSSRPIVKEARIISLSDPLDDACSPLHKGKLPDGSKLLAIGRTLDDFDLEALKKEEPNVVFVCYAQARKPLVQLLEALPSIEWVHSRAAGIDFIASEGLAASDVFLTNAKGIFSSTLAEYTMMACSYFAKDLPRLMRQKKQKNWEQYNVLELRGATLGVIGYGDIGRACAKLAKAYGMNVIALRRNPAQSKDDPYCDAAYGNDSLNRLMSESDYILIAAPLTEETRDLVDAEAFAHAKPGSVLINLGRGPIVSEEALIQSLKDGTIKGAALDVFTKEPLPVNNELWELDNVLVSPHNMDKTATFMHESTEFFVNENLPRFLHGQELLNPVDKAAGY